jgi:hypothetical protein
LPDSGLLPVSFDDPADYPGIAAAAGGAFGISVEHAPELGAGLAEALRVVREEKRSAVSASASLICKNAAARPGRAEKAAVRAGVSMR